MAHLNHTDTADSDIMSKFKISPFAIMVDSAAALAAAERLAQTLPKRVSSLDLRTGKAVNDEVALFDAQIEASR